MTVANASTRDWPASVLVATRLVSLAVVCAALYWGQAVLVPLVLAADSDAVRRHAAGLGLL